MGTSAQYAATVQNGNAQVTAANAARDGSGAIVDVFAGASPSGSRLDDLSITATGTTTAGMIRLFLHNGVTSRLWKEVTVSAVIPGANTPCWSADLKDMALVLKYGYKLQASTEKAETFNLNVTRAGDF